MCSQKYVTSYINSDVIIVVIIISLKKVLLHLKKLKYYLKVI